jgi:citrate lyase subunit alpha/citrate CoA-transferase
VPIARKTNPIIKEEVTTITSPGELIDLIVTEVGFSVNTQSVRPEVKQRNEDIKNKLIASGLNCLEIEELRKMALKDREDMIPNTGDRLVGMVKYIDGTVLDSIYSVME